MATNRSTKQRKLQVLKELNNTLQIHAERLHLGDLRDRFSERQTKTDRHKTRNVPALNSAVDAVVDDTGLIEEHTTGATNHPVSPARKRRLARDVVRSYRPGYSWNRGGRLKELKIRCVARKYVTIWKQKAFGRILPSIARRHYAQNLMRMAFSVLHVQWYANRREWRLQVRAACHDRYRLWNRVWKQWRMYTRFQREKNAQLAKASNFYEQKLMMKAVLSWQLHTLRQREKNVVKRQARSHLVNFTLRTKFDVWRARLHALRSHRQLDVYAGELYLHRLLLNHWRVWQYKLYNLRLQDERLRRAGTFYRTNMLRKTWNALSEYVNLKKQKQTKYAEARRYHYKKVLKAWLATWRSRLQAKVDLARKEDTVVAMGEWSKLRRCLQHWKHYVRQKREMYEMETTALEYSTRRLKANAINALRLSVMLRRVKNLRHLQAEEFRTLKVKRRAWDVWTLRCDEKEELRLSDLTNQAQAHFKSVLLTDVVKKWQLYVLIRREEKAQLLRCNVHYSWTLLSKHFRVWTDYVALQRWKDDAADHAAALYRENMEAKYFYIWQREYRISMDVRTMERVAVLHFHNKLGKRFLTRWRQRTSAVFDDYENMTLATDHYNLHLLSSMWTTWRCHVQEVVREESQQARAVQFRSSRVKRLVLRSLTLNISHSRRKRERLQLAEQHAKKRLLLPLIARWCSLAVNMKERRSTAEHLYLSHRAAFSRKVMDHWRAEAKVLSHHRRLVSGQRERHMTSLMSKVVGRWRAYTAARVERRQQDEQKIAELQESIGQVVRRRVFDFWRCARDRAVLSRLKYEQACIHNDRKLLTSAMTAWHAAVHVNKHKKVLKQQAELACQHRLRVKYLTHWKNSLNMARIEKEKTYTALYQWSLVLQRKCLIEWFYYAESRKQKKSAYQQAMVKYKQSLLSDGLRQWIIAADSMSQMRQRLAVDCHMKSAHQSALLARKCVDRWRAFTRDGRGASSNTHPAVTPLDTVLPATKHFLSSPVKVRQQPVVLESATAMPSLSAVIPLRRVSGERKPRPLPKLPSYLMASLERDGLWKAYTTEEKQDLVEDVITPSKDAEQMRIRPTSPPTPGEPSPPVLLKPSHFLCPSPQRPAIHARVKETDTAELMPPDAFQYKTTQVDKCMSPRSPARTQQDHLAEVEHIKSTLLQYKHDRRRLRTLNEQLSILRNCFADLEQEDQREAEQEIDKLAQEVAALAAGLKDSKGVCQAMALRLSELSTIV